MRAASPIASIYLPLGGALPRPSPEGFPVLLGRFATGGAFEPLDLLAGTEPLLVPPDFDIAISLVARGRVAG